MQPDDIDARRYTYASGDPLNRVDPSGHDDIPIVNIYASVPVQWTVTQSFGPSFTTPGGGFGGSLGRSTGVGSHGSGPTRVAGIQTPSAAPGGRGATHPNYYHAEPGILGWRELAIPPTITNAAVGFGDGVSFGATSFIRRHIGYDGGYDRGSALYLGARGLGTVLGLYLSMNAAIPESLSHFTTAEGAAGIEASGGVINPTTTGLFGDGVYAARIGPPLNPFVPLGSTVPISVSGAGFMRIIPQLVYLQGGSLTTFSWAAAAWGGLMLPPGVDYALANRRK